MGRGGIRVGDGGSWNDGCLVVVVWVMEGVGDGVVGSGSGIVVVLVVVVKATILSYA